MFSMWSRYARDPKTESKSDQSGSAQPSNERTSSHQAQRSSAPRGEDKSFASLPTIATITEEDVKKALYEEAARNATWKQKHVEKMKINSIRTDYGYMYVVETFIEQRHEEERVKPYAPDTPLDAVDDDNPPPEIWDIPISPNELFEEQTIRRKIPRTDRLVSCNTCVGSGRVGCEPCKGGGEVPCKICAGSGVKQSPLPKPEAGHPPVPPPALKSCSNCDGSKVVMCLKCRGVGEKTCTSCRGSGEMLNYVQLVAEYKLCTSSYLYETRIPDEIVRTATLKSLSGPLIFQEQAANILPIRNHPVRMINQTSRKLISEQNEWADSAHVLQQRHWLLAIPVSEVSFKLRKKREKFWVYGEERNVYIKRYPSTCNIL